MILDALAWLRKRSYVDGTVVVNGFSRGAELAMLIGSLDDPDKMRMPDAVIAHSPSDTHKGQFNWAWDNRCWTCKKEKAPCTDKSPDSDYDWNGRCETGADKGKIDQSISAWRINGKVVPVETRIPVEKFDGPVLITSGDEDELWKSREQVQRIEAAMTRPVNIQRFTTFLTRNTFLKGRMKSVAKDSSLVFYTKLWSPKTKARQVMSLLQL